jgi:glycerophosphoryl diester phosphodiesterase
VITSALIDSETAVSTDEKPSPWLAGLRLESFSGLTSGERIAEAANSIEADILSPADIESYDAPDPSDADYKPFTTRQMIKRAHELGLAVKPWTVNRLSVAEQLFDWGVDGIITDYPNSVRRLVKQRQLPVPPKYPKKRVLECLDKHLAPQK